MVLYNPLTYRRQKNMKISLYYTGLKDYAMISERGNQLEEYKIDRDNNIILKVNIEAESLTWFLIKTL
ncbi:MAG: hypothetical protein GF364_13770 [Candidatus Lokiarchaeota archaeon]|nr:hypothetical protein [Candidatus Lokiarchaeota archaeon]